MINYSSNQQIADELNDRARTRRAFVISRHGLGDGYRPGDNPDLFPGQTLVDAERMDGQQWSAALVGAELADVDCDPVLVALKHLEHIRSVVESLAPAVADARNAGCSWASIGEALGVTKQAAQQRFGD